MDCKSFCLLPLAKCSRGRIKGGGEPSSVSTRYTQKEPATSRCPSVQLTEHLRCGEESWASCPLPFRNLR